MGCEDVDWTHLAESLTGSCEHVNETSGSIEGREFLHPLSDY
jgi:hypothetical protein